MDATCDSITTFKFSRDQAGCCRMHYKEWSSDTFWLPQSGVCLLPPGTGILLCICIILFTFPKLTGDFIVAQKPKGVCPFYDLDYLKKLESTVKKASA